MTRSAPAALAVQGRVLERTYASGGSTVQALRSVSFDILQGSFVVVVGPSGCGKSTLLNLIGLLDQPTSGALTVLAQDVTSCSRREAALFRRAHLGYLFQDAGLIDRMSALENVALPLAYRGTGARERREAASNALTLVGLDERAQASVEQLSGGERQRVGLARALASQPAILVCDEPTASLDQTNSLHIAEVIAERARNGVTVICSSHDPTLISRADQVLSMSHGRIVEREAA